MKQRLQSKQTSFGHVVGDMVLILTIVMGFDQLSKWLMRSNGIGQLNEGIAFGVFPTWFWLAGIFCVLVGLVVIIIKTEVVIDRILWIMIWAAGVSNWLDRWFLGGVWDWIHYPVINVVGNVADVILGVVVMIMGFRLVWNSIGKNSRVKFRI